MNVVDQLATDQGVSHLDDSVTELQRVHEEHQRGHAHPVLPAQSVPVIPPYLYLPRQGGVESTEARGQHLERVSRGRGEVKGGLGLN